MSDRYLWVRRIIALILLALAVWTIGPDGGTR